LGPHAEDPALQVFAEQRPQLAQRIQAAAHGQQADQRGAPAGGQVQRLAGRHAQQAFRLAWKILRRQQRSRWQCQQRDGPEDDEKACRLGMAPQGAARNMGRIVHGHSLCW
jgi:hypothetical protein